MRQFVRPTNNSIRDLTQNNNEITQQGQIVNVQPIMDSNFNLNPNPNANPNQENNEIRTAEGLKTVFHNIHNVLRNGEGLAEQDAMNQFNIIFTLKLLEDKIKNKEIDISDEFIFSKLVAMHDGSYQATAIRKYLLEIKKNNKYRQVLYHEYALKDPENLRRIISYIDDIDFENINEDLRGKMYEYYYGRERSTIGALGQFFTNREIVDCVIHYIDKLGYLTLDENGNIPTICDPTCGSAGFLVSLINKLKNKYPTINWNEQQNRIYGYDVSPFCVKNSGTNLLCSTGVFFTNISQRNTLTNKTHLDKYDIYIGNPPFGGDLNSEKTKYHSVFQEIKDNINIPIDVKQAIFTQIFMYGTSKICGIVLPEGIFFSNKYIALRKKLVEDYDIKYIVDIPSDSFENTTTKTCVLIFTVGKTTEIKFVDFSKYKNEDEGLIIKVNIDKIRDKKYYLLSGKYIDNIQNINENYEIIKIKDLCIFDNKKNKYKATDGFQKGKYRFYTSSQEKVLFRDDYEFSEYKLIIGRGGNPSINFDSKFSISHDDVYVLSSKDNINYDIRYIYYYLKGNIDILQKGFIGTTIKHISKEYINDINIPIPSPEIQKQFIDKIQEYTDLIFPLRQTIRLHKPFDSLVDDIYLKDKSKYQMMKIKDIVRFLPKSNRKAGDGKNEGKYRFYICSNVKEKWFDIADYKEEAVIIGTGGNPVINYDINFSCSTDNIIIKSKNENVLTSWIYYIFKYKPFYLKNGFIGTTIRHITKEYISDLEIPIPTMDMQIEAKENVDHIFLTKKLLQRYEKIEKDLIQEMIKNSENNDCNSDVNTNNDDHILNLNNIETDSFEDNDILSTNSENDNITKLNFNDNIKHINTNIDIDSDINEQLLNNNYEAKPKKNIKRVVKKIVKKKIEPITNKNNLCV